ncbi:5-dehydro-2-deoxygluconokinase [Streptomyces sp. CB03234]|uniref:5-dehydro-2-deoxygluconokinase n=1 Tax=Streptomyces sp. (strain CB03234) TaxID=1703937 RepID=UPI00093B4866|nr:5-dehydro-2-deoxygluconokinase [Streptomyces sp. CB03234]OKK07772.1 5-dehydro-2-deoxygluconokinase [Streptomyces sp. CB03234]
MATDPYDLITMGRIGVDLYPLQTGVPLAQVETFGKFLGGSASNVAVAAARLGRRTALITRTGADPFGEYLHQELRAFGVDDRWVTPVEAYPTPLTFCEIFPPDHFPLYFYRQPKAPDLEIHEHELDLAAIAAARVFWMTGTGLSDEPSRTATLAAMAARSGVPDAGVPGPSGRPVRPGDPSAAYAAGPDGRVTVFDLDWRPMFWPDEAEARPHYREALRHATVAVGNLDECEIATGEREPYRAARALLDAGVRLAVVKQGPKGVLAITADGDTADVPPVPVEVVNGLGAGDAFGGALCHGLLAGWDLERTVRYANAAGAIVAARLACSSAMPFPDEVSATLEGASPEGASPDGASPEGVSPEGVSPDGASPAASGHAGDARPEGGTP